MLIQFVVENFRSFRDKAVLSMRAPAKSDDTTDVLRAAVIYGANASGKSNLVAAIRFAQLLIRKGTASKQRIPVQPFKLDPAASQRPSRFEFIFECDTARYAYGFLVNPERVLGEWLYRSAEDEDELVYQREFEAEANRYSFELGARFVTDPLRRQFYGFVHDGTRANQLFLREAEDRNAAELQPVIAWFDGLAVIRPDDSFSLLGPMVEQDRGFRDAVADLLCRADTGVGSIEMRLSKLAPEEVEHLFESPPALPEIGDGVLQRVDSPAFLRRNEAGDVEYIRLVTQRVTGETRVDFELDEESDGTLRLLNLAPVLHRWDATAVYVIDEIDRSLHALLTRFFLREFLVSDAGNQLICTTHDTHLLEGDLLGPEAVWFTEKDRDGASHLYSLDEFEAEQLAVLKDDRQAGYLMGRFGAIPYLGDASRLPRREDLPEDGDEGDED